MLCCLEKMSLAEEKNVTKRNDGIDFLKALCMIAVVSLHSQRSIITGTVNNVVLYYIARFAMPCFFMINGYLVLNREEFTFGYYKKKILNMIRVLLSGGGIAFVYTLISLRDGVDSAVYNAIKCILGYYVIPFWWIYTFAIIYTILLFSFQKVKNYIQEIVIILLIICFAIDLFSFFEIFVRNGYFIQAAVSQRFRIWTWLMYFCLGYLLGNLEKTKKDMRYVAPGVIIMSGVVLILQCLVCKDYLGRINSEYLYDNMLLVIWVSLLFLLFTNRTKQLGKVTRSFCNNSFGIFMLHEFFLEGLGLTEKFTGPFQSAILLFILLMVCWCITALMKLVLVKCPYPVSKLLDY